MSHRLLLPQSSQFLSCFRPATNGQVAPPRIPTHPNLTTSLYRTESGLFGLTWSGDLLGLSLHIHVHLDHHLTSNNEPREEGFPTQFTNTKPSFHLKIRPWKKHGSQRLLLPSEKKKKKTAVAADVYWDLSKAKFGSGPAPSSGFYVAILIDGEMSLLVGDANPRATAGTTAAAATNTNNNIKLIRPPPPTVKVKQQQEEVMFLRREHVYGNKQMLYTTKTDFGVTGGGEREITIDCRLGVDDPRLYFSIDNKRVLQIKHLKWKFRGNERIQVDGIPIQVSWDVHNWLFQKQQHEDLEADGYALFMFKFENPSPEFRYGFQDDLEKGNLKLNHHQQTTTCGFGFGFETTKMKKGLNVLRSGRSSYHSSSSSSSSLSSASSGCSSVMEWESVEENELKDPSGFSLLVYAWKS